MARVNGALNQFLMLQKEISQKTTVLSQTPHAQCPTPLLPIPFMSDVYPIGHSIRLVVIVSSEGRICLNISVGSNLLMRYG